MNKILLALVCLISTFNLQAQFKPIASGPLFDEPETGFSKILLLQNRNTIFFNITLKNGITIKIYDAEHKEKTNKVLAPAYGELKAAVVNSIFEMKGDVVIMISTADGKTPVLYRLIIDGQSGSLKEEMKIAELASMSMAKGYAVMFGNVPVPEFHVRKDPGSDNYGVVLFNSFESDRNKRIEAIFFGEDHKEKSRAYYTSPDEKYKYLEYIDMAVIGNQKLSILAYAFNTGRDKGSELLLANLEAGAKKMAIQKLKFSEDRIIKWGITRFNPLSKKLMVLVSALVEKKGYEAFLCTIDPFTQQLEKITDGAAQGLNEAYSGMPQNLLVNKDGSFTIVYEEMTITSGTYGSRNQFSSTESWLGAVAICLYNKEEKLTKSYLVKKMHVMGGESLSPFYLSDREGSAQAMAHGNQYKSFSYLNGGEKNYVLINDIERNRESTRGNKVVSIRGLGECDGYFFNISGANGSPERSYLFGAPDDKKTHNMGLFAISDYNSEANIYTTLKLEKIGKEKGVRVIWLQP
jgi:hypothetical protein